MTPAQGRVLDFIRRFMLQNPYPPTFREIADGLGYGSVSTVYVLCSKLRALGRIEWEEGKPRTMRIT